MANYIGNAPTQGEFKKLDSITSLFDGVTSLFALKFNGSSVQVGDANQLLVSVNGVVQEPLESYTLGTGGSQIQFTSVPPIGSTCFITMFGAVGGVANTIADNSVTSAKIADGAVNTTELANNAVTIAKLPSTGTPDSTKFLRGDGIWKVPGFSGSNTVSGTVDITLTNTSTQIQRVTMTAAGKRVILPDATTMPIEGVMAFMVVNEGYLPFDIADSTGGRLISVNAGASLVISLKSKAAATGGWIYGDGSIFLKCFSKNTTAFPILRVQDNYRNTLSLTLHNATTVVAGYVGATDLDNWMVVGTISGNAITWGTPQLAFASSADNIYVVALTDTTGLVHYVVNGTGSYAHSYSISGTVITVSSLRATVGATPISFVKLDSTRAFVLSTAQMRVITHAGTGVAPTLGTANTTGTYYAGGSALLIDTDKLVLFGNAPTPSIVIATVTGTTVALGTVLTFAASPAVLLGSSYGSVGAPGTVPKTALIPISTTKFCLVTSLGYLISTQIFTVSGTVITLASTNTVDLRQYLNDSAFKNQISMIDNAAYAGAAWPYSIRQIAWMGNNNAVICFRTFTDTDPTSNDFIQPIYGQMRLSYVTDIGFYPVGQPVITTQNDFQPVSLLPIDSTTLLAMRGEASTFLALV